ncbi:DUF4355 domain-containing protein [Staphylococcus haemolyticus]|uniref:DUF4355 domain-containing protein n=1 Tax=Staphylococcus haemolyticus TaxID=1283 RepID=A0AB38PHB0_STAHA|nr:DUF4355 domain-containing protein [Staphylococcus haemolyticus]PTK53119.1 hypothetical protein BUZ37_09560 [Staphylococcus haemolyticus]TRL79243.1 DUF4355 domain-containing protein [Staphylococcus haemolyticus]
MENNQSNITEEAKSNEKLETPNEQAQYNEKTFSQEEVSQMIKDRLARERRKSDERIKDAIQEAEKLAKMNKDQKSQYEIEKLMKENEALKVEKALSQMRNETRSMLSESGVENFDDQIINVLVNSDAETTKKNVESFTNLLNKMVKSNVEKALRQNSPVNTQTTGMTKQDIMSIKDDVQRQKAIAQNINLFS